MKHLSDLRRTKRQQRQLISQSELSLAGDFISQTIAELRQFTTAKNIGLYWPIDHEICTQTLISLCLKQDKAIYLPKTIPDSNTLLFVRYHADSVMGLDKHNIPCPQQCEDSVIANHLDLAIIPLLACNEKQYRLGYGGGFYDRTFSGQTNTYLIGVGYDFQLDSRFKEAQHDLQVDQLILAQTAYAKR